MMKRIKIATLFLAALAMLAVGCVQPSMEKPASPGTGFLKVNLGDDASRTLMPSRYDPNYLYYTLTFTTQGREPVIGHIDIGETFGEFTLIAGTWNLAVQGFASAGDAADPAKALANGSKSGIEVSAFTATEASVALSPGASPSLTRNATGTLNYDISFPPETHRASLTVYNEDGVTLTDLNIYDEDSTTALTPVDNPVSLKETNTGNITLASGVYNLGITLYMGSKTAVMGTSAHIYDGLVTVAAYSFTKDDFFDYNQEIPVTAFTLKAGSDSYNGRIDHVKGIITVFAPDAVVTGLTAEFAHTGFSIDPDPAVARDYTNPVAYTVNLEDGPAVYTVRVQAASVITSVSELYTFLSSASGGETPDNPIPVKIRVDLTNSTNGWKNILDTIQIGPYVDIDLSECTMTGMTTTPGEFDPSYNFSGYVEHDGREFIVGLTLPNETTSIGASYSYAFPALEILSASGLLTFDGFGDCESLASVNLPAATTIDGFAFTSLVSVNLPAATTIDDLAFWGCTSLTSVNLPAATFIDDSAFIGCTNLASVNLPVATYIGDSAFEDTNLASVNLPVATSIGDFAFKGCTSLASLELPVVTTIGGGAFQNCTNLASIYLPVAATIGGSTFEGCTSLASVELPAVTTIYGDFGNWYRGAFQNCTNLASIYLPVATTIGSSAFKGCTSLVSVELPIVDSIGDGVFEGCTNLASLDLPEATTIGNSAFSGCVSFASLELSKATTIGERAFQGCTNLASLELPVITTIGDRAFSRCTSLASLELPETTTIGDYAFQGCTSLASLELPETTTIGDYAFQGCTSLASLELPETTSIGDYAFQGCTSLASVELNGDIGDYAFTGCASLASVELIGQGGNIGAYAFSGCANLASLELSPGCSRYNIENHAFSGCTSLTSLELSVYGSIDNYAFQGCTSLASVVVKQCSLIHNYTFQGCTSLTTVELRGTGPEYDSGIGNSAFADTGNTPLTISLSRLSSRLGTNMFDNVTTPKTVTVLVPSGTTGWGFELGTYSGSNTTNTWGNGFRGRGWTGSNCLTGTVNSNITLTIDYLPE